MSRKRINNVMRKEWRVMASDLGTFFLIILLPLLIVGQGILYIWLADRFAGIVLLSSPFFQGALQKLGQALPSIASFPPGDQLRVLLLSQFNFWLLLIPTMIAITSATYNIVDEKVSGSLEALLATPVRTWELLLGKALSGAIPALVMTWLSGAVFILIVILMGWGRLVSLVLNSSWFLTLFLLTPAVALLSFMLGVIGSSKARDAKGAQNIVLVIIFPVLLLIVAQIAGLVWFTPLLTLLLSLAICLVDYFILRIAVALFQRESIVVKWR